MTSIEYILVLIMTVRSDLRNLKVQTPVTHEVAVDLSQVKQELEKSLTIVNNLLGER